MAEVSEGQRRYDMGYATGRQEGFAAGFAQVGVKVTKDGDQWCALVGETLQDGIAGFGLTPSGALMDLMATHGDTLNEALGGHDVEIPDGEEEDDADG